MSRLDDSARRPWGVPLRRGGPRLARAAWALALLGCAPAPLGPPGHAARSIAGGVPVTAGWDGVAAVLLGGELHCSALLVAGDAALTAAHCVPVAARALTLAFGEHASKPAQTVAVREAIVHPLWVGVGNPPAAVGQANDLALLLLEEELPLAPLLLASPAVAEAALRDAEVLTLVGFGAAAAGGAAGQKATAEASLVQVGDYELRVGRPGEPQACDGDSGGPALLVAAGVLRAVGLVSRAVAPETFCDQGAIYTRLDAYLGFVQDLVRLPCGSGLAPPCSDGGVPRAADAAADALRADGGSTSGGVWTGGGGEGRPIDDGGCALLGAAPQPAAWGVFGLGVLRLVRRRRSGRALRTS